MPGRKSPDRRQGRGTTDVVVPFRSEIEVPPLPSPAGGRVLASTKRAWTAFWEDQLLAPMVRPADMAPLVRLFHLYDERERAVKAYRAERAVTGSTGQLVVNPFEKAVASMDARIDKLEERFGITPKARLALGIAMGAAAKSLEDINRGFEDDDDTEGEEHDPRVTAIEADARDA